MSDHPRLVDNPPRRPPLSAAVALPTAVGPGPPFERPGFDRFGQPYQDPRTVVPPVAKEDRVDPVELAAARAARAAEEDRAAAERIGYRYSYDDPAPPEADRESLQALLVARPRAREEVLDAVRALDRLAAYPAATQPAGRVGGGLAEALGQALPSLRGPRPAPDIPADLARRRAVYWRRAADLAALEGVELPPIIDPRKPGLADVERELADVERELEAQGGYAADHYGYARMGTLEPDKADLEAQIWRLARERTAAEAQPQRHAWPQDVLLGRLNDLVRRRRALAHQIVALEAAESARSAREAALVTGTAVRVSRAVESAGGAEAVELAIAAAWVLEEPHAPVDPELGRIAADLARLAAAGISGPSVDSARARRSELTARAEAEARDKVDARKARAGALLADALAGEAEAVESLRELASSSPAAFVGGFAEALEERNL